MKKLCQLISVAMVICLVFTFVSCGGTKVTFDIGDATLVSGETEQLYKEDAPVSAPVLEKDGYVFDGWDKDFSNPTEEVVVKPIWKKIHTVAFNVEGALANDTSLLIQKIKDGEAATAPELTKEGYVFDGWDQEFSAVTSDLTITAKWKKIHTVIFDLNGGTVADESTLVQKVTDGMSAEAPVPTSQKYNFVQWDQDVSVVTGDMTVKAVWERKTFTSTEIFSLVNPATVEIKVYRPNHVYYGLGSGFFINEDGILLTNYHVIANASEFVVTTSDGVKYTVTKVMAYDKELDIAVLQVDTQGKKVAYLDIAETLPKAGEAVWALGSSLGLTGTFSSGIVSYVNRDVNGIKFIQTTTPISSGNSGGPLVNEQGYVIGINSASYTAGQNLNLAVEISQYKTLPDANITPMELFRNEATLKYWVGEQLVYETNASSIGQLLEDGSTLVGSHDGGEDYDFYMVEHPHELAFLLVMIRADNEEALEEIAYYMSAFTADDDIGTNADWLPDEYIVSLGILEENGVSYYTALVVASPELSDLSENVGVAIASDQPTGYQVFLYYITEEIANELAALG